MFAFVVSDVVMLVTGVIGGVMVVFSFVISSMVMLVEGMNGGGVCSDSWWATW
jgi:hypothetical protein